MFNSVGFFVFPFLPFVLFLMIAFFPPILGHPSRPASEHHVPGCTEGLPDQRGEP